MKTPLLTVGFVFTLLLCAMPQQASGQIFTTVGYKTYYELPSIGVGNIFDETVAVRLEWGSSGVSDFFKGNASFSMVQLEDSQLFLGVGMGYANNYTGNRDGDFLIEIVSIYRFYNFLFTYSFGAANTAHDSTPGGYYHHFQLGYVFDL